MCKGTALIWLVSGTFLGMLAAYLPPGRFLGTLVGPLIGGSIGCLLVAWALRHRVGVGLWRQAAAILAGNAVSYVFGFFTPFFIVWFAGDSNPRLGVLAVPMGLCYAFFGVLLTAAFV